MQRVKLPPAVQAANLVMWLAEQHRSLGAMLELVPLVVFGKRYLVSVLR